MDFYLTNLTSGVRLRIPILPDRLSVKTGAMTAAFNIIKTGEVKIPRGSMLTGYSWNSTFPGEAMRNMSFVYDWQAPEKIIPMLKDWMDKGDTLRFMVTDLSINTDVFIETFTYEYYGGMGDVSYTLTLTTRRELLITTVPAQTTVPNSSSSGSSSFSNSSTVYGTVKLSNTGSYLNVRQKASTSSKSIGRLSHGTRIQILEKYGNWYIIPWSGGADGKAYVYASYVVLDTQASSSSSSSGSSGGGSSGGSAGSSGSKGGSAGSSGSSKTSAGNSTYNVKDGDTLYSIAKAMLGDGSRWTEIYELNKAAIDKANAGKTVSKYTVYSGTSLKLPSKTTSASASKASSSSASSIFAKTVKSVVSAASTAAKTIATKKPSSVLVSAATTAVKTIKTVSSTASGLLSKLKTSSTKKASKSSVVKNVKNLLK